MCCAVLSALAVLAPTAHAEAEVLGHVGEGRALVAGPVFAGTSAVWVEQDARGALHVAPAGLILRPPPDGLRHRVVDVAASAQHVALVRSVFRPPPPEPPCDTACPASPAPPPAPVADEVWAGPRRGPLRRVLRRDARAQCAGSLAPVGVEVAGPTVVVAEEQPDVACAESAPPRLGGRVTEFAPGRPPRTLAELGAEQRPGRLAAAGGWVAWQTTDALDGMVVVFDRRRRRIAYRVRAERFQTTAFALDGTGRLALLGNPRPSDRCGPSRPRTLYRLATTTPDLPVPNLLPLHGLSELVAVGGDRIVASAVVPCDAAPAVVARRVGGLLSHAHPFALPPTWRLGTAERAGFDGKRLLVVTPGPPEAIEAVRLS